MNKNREELKIKIQKLFTEIRTQLNNREDELLLEIDKKFDELYFKDEFIDEIEKLPNKIKMYIEKGKEINNNNNNNHNLNYINDCINIENMIKDINDINKNIVKVKNQKYITILYLIIMKKKK